MNDFSGDKCGVHLVDLVFETLDLGFRHAQRLIRQLFAAIGHAQISAEIEQVILNAQQHGIDERVGVAQNESGPYRFGQLVSSTVPYAAMRS